MKVHTSKLRQVLRRMANNPRNSKSLDLINEAMEATYEIDSKYSSSEIGNAFNGNYGITKFSEDSEGKIPE